ncbi:hypothetical protein [Arcicella rosea]|uniref:Uncharacterized protein n=1 Tax=Arcicella rosea TaxID=502909 RepID=A0A841ENA0_9BACT|nr:hypothetical protein [Arcicella rosea]MBB6002208.1 hypothetical protein [Arcicella rosea]
MKTRNKLSSIDDSMFNVIENRKLALLFGGATGSTTTVTYSKKKKTNTTSNDGSDSYPGEQ